LLEPYDAKVSRTVLRGEGSSNAPDLLDTLEQKRTAIALYNQGHGSTVISSRQLDVTERIIRRWIRRYREVGLSGLSYKIRDGPFKESIVREIREKYVPFEEISARYAISEASVRRWVKAVQTEGYAILYKPSKRGRPPKIMGRPKKKGTQTELEKLQEELEYLRAENALLKKEKALVEEKESRLRSIGQKPSKN